MKINPYVSFFEEYHIWLIIFGFALLGSTVLPRLLSKHPLSMPIVLLVIGYAITALPLGINAPDLKYHGTLIEHITELGVIIAITGAGLKLDRRPSFRGWSITWRLLGITMALTIAATAFLGWWLAALVPATAVLLGAVVAPTDPVLASEVEVEGPGEGEKENYEEEKEEDKLRFALTSEAGLNDGLAFPFTNMALAMVFVGANPKNWLGDWLLWNVAYELIVAVIIGLGMGYLLARTLISITAESPFARSIMGLGALAATLLIYGTTEFFGGYGFIATFFGAVVIRQYKPNHPYHAYMNALIEKTLRLFIVVILICLGAAVAGGLLDPLNWQLVLIAVLLIFVIRPLSGMIGLAGHGSFWQEHLAISFLGIRGIGSLYYLVYALNKEDFAGADQLWAVVALIVIISVIVHGVTTTAIIKKLEKIRAKKEGGQ